MRCRKCKSDCQKPGSYIIHVGRSFYLCAFCANIWENIPTNCWHLFMLNESKDCSGIKENLNPIDFDMLCAREDRAEGRSNKWNGRLEIDILPHNITSEYMGKMMRNAEDQIINDLTK